MKGYFIPPLLTALLVVTLTGHGVARGQQRGVASRPAPVVPPGAALPWWAAAQGVAPLSQPTPKQIQDARAVREERRQNSLDRARERLEEYLHRRPLTAPVVAGQLAERRRLAAMKASPEEVAHGDHTNVLLQCAGRPGRSVPEVKVPWEVVEHLPVRPQLTRVNLSLLRAGSLSWPGVLKEERFSSQREAVEQALATARGSVTTSGGRPTRRQIADVRAAHQALQAALSDLTSSQLTRERRFVKDLETTVEALAHRDIARLLSDEWRAGVSDLTGLIRRLDRHGLELAPARTERECRALRRLHALACEHQKALAAE